MLDCRHPQHRGRSYRADRATDRRQAEAQAGAHAAVADGEGAVLDA
jgi:hypothetical protein